MLIYNKTVAPCSVEGFTDNVILYHFPDQFLSDNFFNHVLILIIKWSIKNHHRVCRIYRGIGFFDFQSGKQNFTLQYCSTSYSIKCYISVHRNEVHNEDLWEQRLKLFEHLKQCIGDVHSSLMPKATPPDCCIYCPLHDKDDPGPHLPFVGDMQLFKYCTVLRKDVPPSAYNLLVKPNKQPRLVECAVFIDDIADKTNKPAMKELNRYVVTKYAVKWKEIGGELGLKPSVINDIAADFQSFDRNKHENCLKEVFKKWLEVDTGACWKKLELVLTNVDRAGQNFPPVSDIYDSTLNESKGNTYTDYAHSPPSKKPRMKISCDDNGSSQPKLAELVEHVGTSVHEKWYNLGLQLGVNDDTLDQIEKSESKSDIACRKMFKAWLREKHDGTWNDVFLALKSHSVDESNLAESLK
ncbi:uncharacterized protein [Dysidea avara]|uniref:uncharacterized protein isoform X3 n=1 Tax=Dysidea avara TaxID=196820 RepID=UPI00331FF74E